MFFTFDTKISKATLKKMAGQLWYLSEELVGLALFNDDLDNGTKDRMVSAMKEKEGEEEPLKHATIDLKFVQDKTVVDFATKNNFSKTWMFQKTSSCIWQLSGNIS